MTVPPNTAADRRAHVATKVAQSLSYFKDGQYEKAHRVVTDACNLAKREYLGTEAELNRLHQIVGQVASCFPGNHRVNHEAHNALREVLLTWGEEVNSEPLRYGVRQVGIQERFVPEAVAELLQRAAVEIRESRRVPGTVGIDIPRETNPKTGANLDTFEVRVHWTTL